MITRYWRSIVLAVGRWASLAIWLLILAWGIIGAAPSQAWPIKYIGQRPSYIQVVSSCDVTNEARRLLSHTYNSMKELSLTRRENLAYFPFARTEEMNESPSIGAIAADGHGGLVLLRVAPDQDGINCFVYLFVPKAGSENSTIGPVPEEVIALNVVQSAIAAATRYAVRRCQNYIRLEKRETVQGGFSTIDPSVTKFCLARGQERYTEIRSEVVALATVAALIQNGVERYALITNQDQISFVELE